MSLLKSDVQVSEFLQVFETFLRTRQIEPALLNKLLRMRRFYNDNQYYQERRTYIRMWKDFDAQAAESEAAEHAAEETKEKKVEEEKLTSSTCVIS